MTLPDFRSRVHVPLNLFVVVVLVQSLFFKFTGAPETVYIFERTLEPWAASHGLQGAFAPGGLFSARVVGIAELAAALLLVLGLVYRPWRVLEGLGGLLSVGVLSGAICFHLFTPLGLQVRNADGTLDGGLLFILSCGVWLSSGLLVALRRPLLLALIRSGVHRDPGGDPGPASGATP